MLAAAMRTMSIELPETVTEGRCSGRRIMSLEAATAIQSFIGVVGISKVADSDRT